MATDTSGNQAVDFAWGNLPMQPNSDRTDGTPIVVVANNASENKQWSGYSTYPSARLDAALDNHANAEAGWAGYPSFIASAGNYIVTAVSGDGTTVTYTSQNKLAAGDVVNITGLTASAYNLSSATVVSANAGSFTVTNSANAGLITGQYGKVQSTTALTDADGAGIGYIIVPDVRGLTTAVALDALKDAGYETANITTATAATNAAKAITDVQRTSGSTTATITVTGGTTSFPVGTKVVVAGLNDGAGSLTVNGTWTVTGGTGSTITVTTTATTAVNISAPLTGTPTVVGLAGTIKSQSTAGGTASVATTATITITPYATAS